MSIKWCPVCGGVLQIVQYPVAGQMISVWKCTEPDCPYEAPVSEGQSSQAESASDE